MARVRAHSAPAPVAKYENDPRPKGVTFLFAQPRSGSTLALRLLANACHTRVVGDHDLKFYESVLGVYDSALSGGQYGYPPDLEKADVFPDTYRDKDEETDRRMISHYLRYLIFRGVGNAGFHKTTILGFANTMVEPFVTMLREMGETSNYPINIAWLMRDHSEIIKSMATREGPGQETAIKKPEVLEHLLDLQYNQFRSSYELGDALIKYEDLVAKPLETVLKLKPCHYPDDNIIFQVMRKKLR